MEPITHLAIVVPARNEGERLAACLESIAVARRYFRGTVRTVVLLDSCTDDSTHIVGSFDDVTAVHASFGKVGAARAAATRWALDALRSDPATTWIATTDADSTVPAQWLVEQVRLADAGADVVLGAVEPMRSELSSAQQAAWDDTHPDGPATGHVHGANLGVRASAYLAAGGFESLDEHEDVSLVAELRARGARVETTARMTVLTSGRSVGRTPSGYAGYLAALL